MADVDLKALIYQDATIVEAARPGIKRLPAHIAVIPDGNRRWAVDRKIPKEAGYAHGLDPALRLFLSCAQLGVQELTFYGFTSDNTKRPEPQRKAFQQACLQAVTRLSQQNADLLVVGNPESAMFPPELLPFTTRTRLGLGGLRVNLLVNYDWKWDLFSGSKNGDGSRHKGIPGEIRSRDVARIDLLIRWGGRRRLSGLLPVQSVYADFYVLDDLWPDYQPQHFVDALRWYADQDITLGG